MSKVLVVDDDESILDAVALILEEANYEVATSRKGEETINLVAKFGPDLILLDCLLSGIDGRHICQKLKLNKDYQKIPIVMISAHPSAVLSIKACGADDFLAKPFDIQGLMLKVKRHL